MREYVDFWIHVHFFSLAIAEFAEFQKDRSIGPCLRAWKLMRWLFSTSTLSSRPDVWLVRFRSFLLLFVKYPP